MRAAVIFAGVLALVHPVVSRDTHVKEGECIQKALDAAKAGDRIVVEAGTYREQLNITTNGISLVGQNAIIIPPDVATTNACTDLAGPGTQAGICIAGTNVALQDLKEFNGEHRKFISVGKAVRDTTVTGFTVKGFSGLNIAVLGAVNALVKGNTVSSSAQYGILTVGSKGTLVKGNTVITERGFPYPFYFIGICMDDLSSVTIQSNEITGYFIGLCVQTNGAEIFDNKVHDNCVGAFVDPGIQRAELHDNTFSGPINPLCPVEFSGGVYVAGAAYTIVKHNVFTGLKNAGKAFGVSVVDDSAGGKVSVGTEIRRNTFSDNDLDVSITATGSGNIAKANDCKTSTPAGLCK